MSSAMRKSGSSRLYTGMAWPAEWARREAMARQMEDQQEARDTLTREYLDQAGIRVALARARADTTAIRYATRGEGPAAGDGAVLDIGEWRRSTLDAADSAHHAILTRITATFDSAQQPTVSPSDRYRILVTLDRINQANERTWMAITAEIHRMADSARAARGGGR